ncbi:hypothetical protein BDZ91DRAFT_537739 [Kalaharituber pfeilii]|nr:hypothetical protein BDZ91DRAFT_537739 [Kalaharituber pfeilii]
MPVELDVRGLEIPPVEGFRLESNNPDHYGEEHCSALGPSTQCMMSMVADVQSNLAIPDGL